MGELPPHPRMVPLDWGEKTTRALPIVGQLMFLLIVAGILK